MFNTMFYLMSVVDVDVAVVSVSVFFSLVKFDDGLEEFIHASTIGKDGRYH